jgi:SAM-dependent methyltransferase
VTDRRSFDERAREWDDDPGKVRRAEAVAGAIRAAIPIPSGARALELGCGTGLLSFALRDGLGHVVLTDTSAGMLEVLGEKIAAAGLEGVFEPRRLDIVADPLPPERFDLVYSLMVLHHFADPDAALARSRAVLRPGGWLCVVDLDAEDGSFHGPGVDVFHGFDRDDLARRAAAAGFVDVRVSTAHVLEKQVDGEDRAYPLFLLVGRADEEGQAPG